MICFGVADACSSYFFGRLVKFTGRIPCFLVGALINYLMIVLMLNWNVNALNKHHDYIFYLIPALWGVADGAWQTQVNSIYGVLFEANQEAAFTNFRLWESLGFAISYAYSNYLCTHAKLQLLLVYLTVGICGYLLIEMDEMGGKRVANTFSMLATRYVKSKSGFFVGITCLFLLLIYFVY